MKDSQIVTTVSAQGEITLKSYRVTDDVERHVSTQVINTADEKIRDALVQIGWTPPQPQSDGGQRFVSEMTARHILVALKTGRPLSAEGMSAIEGMIERCVKT